jgi:radical SAM superfamily enzyme YgiQ (UPF0313 family)
MLAEMDSLYDAGYRGAVFIVDDNFIGNKRNVKEFLPKLIAWQKQHRYPFKFHTEASLNLADDEELMDLMSKANFYKVFLGIETPNLDSLKECNKHQNTKHDLRESVRTIHRHGIQVMGGFIVGFDNDTESIFEAQMKFIQQTGIVTAMVGMLCAFPKTQLWHRLKAEGRLVKENPTGENTDGTLNFVPKMGTKKLLKGYKNLVGSLYSRKAYYKRIRTFIKSYKPTVRGKMSWNDIRAFFKSMLVIGIASNSRFQYWKLFFRTVFTKPKALPMAIELTIYGLHFEKMAKRIASGC